MREGKHVPGWRELVVREAKVAYHRSRRLLAWARHPRAYPAPRLASGRFPHRVYQASWPLQRDDPDAHPVFESGKRTNVSLAAPHFDGLLVAPDFPLSFWRALGRVTAQDGYRPGMELRGGCIVPTLGGGLCLLSNALFDMAVHCGWSILERHGHTVQAVPEPHDRPWGLDATVFWPYVDLRVAPAEGRARLSVRVLHGSLHVAVDAELPLAGSVRVVSEDDLTLEIRGDRVRQNRLVRERWSEDRLVSREVVAVNRKRVLTSALRRRNCMTCEEHSCSAREGHLRLLDVPVIQPRRDCGSARCHDPGGASVDSLGPP
ncbi:MAG: VanW family protein [Candidatus Eremiobacterota bacterium]